MLSLCLLNLLLCFASASEVVTLNSNNFNDLTGSGTWLVDFYAPWCGHCKKLEPIWNKVAGPCKKKNMLLGKVDATVEKELANRFDIHGYPSLVLVRDGESRMYRGGRKEEDLLAFADLLQEEPVRELNDRNSKTEQSAEGLEDMQSSVVFVLFGAHEMKGQAYESYATVAYRLQGLHRFFLAAAGTEGKKVRESYSYEEGSGPVLVVGSDGLEGHKHSGPWELESVLEFVRTHRLPLVSDFNLKTFHDLMDSGKPAIIAVLDEQEESSKEYRRELTRLAPSFNDDFVLAALDSVEYYDYALRFSEIANFIPSVFVLDKERDVYYLHPDKQVEQAALGDFLRAVQNGEVEPIHLSPWYSPKRWEVFLKNYLTDQQILIAGVVGAVLMIGTIFTVCFTMDQVVEERKQDQRSESKKQKKQK